MTSKLKYTLGIGAGVITLGAAAAALAISHDDRPGKFASYDLDGNSTVTLAEVRKVASQRFAVFDVDGNGALVGAEIQLMQDAGDTRHRGKNNRGPDRGQFARTDAASAAVDAENETATQQPVRPVPMDFNGDGSVQSGEFVSGFSARFVLMDTDGNGTLSNDEMRSARRGQHDGRKGGRH